MLRTPGQSLPDSTRAFFEPRFGHDFGRVRVHADAGAAESAHAVDALAYTVGRHIVFGVGQYAPGTTAGKRLLAHELTHVSQQAAQDHHPSPAASLVVGAADTPDERAADRTADAIMAGSIGFAATRTSPAGRIQRACGARGIGSPVGCIGPGGAAGAFVPGALFRFNIECDDFAPGEEGRLVAFAASLPPTASIQIHGFASVDAAIFNTELACARALKARAILTAPTAAGGAGIAPSRIRTPINHGAVSGPAADRRSVTIVTSAPPTPVPPTPVPPTPVPPTPVIAPTSLKFWINAFIPNTLAGAFRAPAGRFAGRQVFPGPPVPFHFNSCFETDDRGFTSGLPAASRMQVFADFDTTTRTLRAGSGLVGGFTFEIDCTTGATKCTSPVIPRGTGVRLIRPVLPGSSRFDILLEAFANDPCVFGSPDIAIRGDIVIDTTARTFNFIVLTTVFPAIEMYVSIRGGTPTPLFRAAPASSSVFILGVPGVSPHSGSGTF